MAKKKKAYVCDECGYDSLQWLGKCPSCETWNSFKEFSVTTEKGKTKSASARKTKVYALSDINIDSAERFSLGSSEFDRVLGGGVYSGTTVLFAGEPGIGKSTLLLSSCGAVSKQGKKVVYISAEESLEQIKSRAGRLGVNEDNLFVSSANEIDEITRVVKEVNPSLVIIDSIQAVYNSEIGTSCGSVAQVREVSLSLIDLAKEIGFVIFLIGHVTKDGTLAGPRTLEHMVDVVVYFEGDRYESLRLVRSVKNRYGSTGEVGIFEMQSIGLVEVDNPSSIFLPDCDAQSPGRATVSIMEGRRPFLIEVQSLLNQTSFNNPLRRALGVEVNKIALILAVIERSLDLSFARHDVFLKAVGGLNIKEPASDLAIAVAILSSYTMKVVDSGTVFVGELGLGGELRKVQMLDERVREAMRLGFKKVVIPKSSISKKYKGIELVEMSTLNEVYKVFFR